LKQINRKKKREKEWMNTIINQASIVDQDSLKNKSHEKIEEAVQSLPCQQKKIYLLRNKGLKRMEIARKLNISVETVKKHSMLTKRFLKKRLIENVSDVLET
jgi:RNA polymerase sigma-70 factor (ECF subfamily)